MINHEIKAQLAKLLATEDLVVEHKNVATAQFDVDKRILTLPQWNKASNVVYDMLVGHEVGHALFTPNKWDFDVPRGIVNVTEDARIEKLMKRKYPGLNKSFHGGYQELSDQDFFCIDGEDIESMNLADRINLHFKIGKFVKIPFVNYEENVIVKNVGDAETFDDAVSAAEQIYNYIKKQKEEEKKVEDFIKDTMNITDGESSSSEIGEDEEENVGDADEIMEIDADGTGDGSEEVDEESEVEGDVDIEVSTDNAFSDGTKNLTTNSMEETIYSEVPKLYLDEVIISNEKVHDLLNTNWKEQSVPMEDECGNKFVADFSYVDLQYNNFKKSAQKEVNYLVKEFETRKSADAYSRSSVSRTGVLDTSKLHTYKFNEDLFKKITVVPDGKNHGLIFVLDWSGSMGSVMMSTLKQLYNLIWFCDKVNIPFDVYSFTNSWCDNDDHNAQVMDMKDGVFYVDKSFRMVNIVTSTAKRKDLDIQLLNIWRVASSFMYYQHYQIPGQMSLSGTPLNESLIALHGIIPEFKKLNGVQKVQCIVLTDGEAGQLSSCCKYNHFASGEEKIGARRFSPYKVVMRNRKTGHTYKFGYHYSDFTEVILKDLRNTFTDTNFIGFRIVSSRDFNHFVKHHDVVNEYELKQSKKKGFHFIQNSGYNSYIALLDSSLDNDDKIDVEDGASKAKIKSAFIKSLKAKALNKKVLNHFVGLVA
tara:strand:- start:672 stop:2780 length:2109 start_codon:yes stop_codon:yes gene_type:complete